MKVSDNEPFLKSKLVRYKSHDSTSLDGYYSTVQGLLDWFEVDLGFTELLFIQIDLCREIQIARLHFNSGVSDGTYE